MPSNAKPITGIPEARILLLDDDPEEAETLRQYLEVDGAEAVRVERADSWQQLLEAIDSGEADLLLLDPECSEKDADSMLAELKESDLPFRTPVIMLADSPSGEMVNQLLESGAADIISRPVDRNQIRGRVGSKLRLKERCDRLVERNNELEEQNQELVARIQDLEMGMEMAHRLQDALLPQKYPRVQNVAFCHKYTPADAIGGDFFHIDSVDDDKAVLFIFDISGHGVRAALVTSAVKTLLDHVELAGKSPGDIMGEVNRRFRNFLGPMAPQIFATSFVMVIDGANYEVSTASAGHPSPLLVRKANMSVQPLLEESDGGPALGFLDEVEYGTVSQDLQEGDIVLGFTDGVYEVRNEESEYYGVERMYELIEHNVRMVPRDLIQKILVETEEFMETHSRPDDICLVSAEIH